MIHARDEMSESPLPGPGVAVAAEGWPAGAEPGGKAATTAPDTRRIAERLWSLRERASERIGVDGPEYLFVCLYPRGAEPAGLADLHGGSRAFYGVEVSGSRRAGDDIERELEPQLRAVVAAHLAWSSLPSGDPVLDEFFREAGDLLGDEPPAPGASPVSELYHADRQGFSRAFGLLSTGGGDLLKALQQGFDMPEERARAAVGEIRGRAPEREPAAPTRSAWPAALAVVALVVVALLALLATFAVLAALRGKRRTRRPSRGSPATTSEDRPRT